MKPFLTGRPQVSVAPLTSLNGSGPQDATARAGGHTHGKPAASGANASAPTVECIRQGDKVVRLVITCSCGERIEVECLYPAGG